MIVVTGASGHVGGLVAAELAHRGIPFRAVTTHPERLPDLGGADVAVGGYAEPDTLIKALEPGDRVFMVSMHAPPERRLELHRAFVDVAVRRRVGRVVYLPSVGAGPDASFVHARSHGATETMLAESGLPFTAVRNGMYADEIASWFDPDGRITGPGGDGRISLSYRPELAAAIVALLTDEGYDDRQVVNVTGPESFSLAQLAAVASEVTGDAYRYAPLDREEWIDYRKGVGRPDWSIELTGNEPLTIREVIALHRAEMPLSSGAAARPG